MRGVILGVLLVFLNLVGIGPPANWTWNLFGDLWKFVLPFLLALAWWAWADASGLNKRREMERMADKKQDRRMKNLEALGLVHKSRRKGKSSTGRP